MYLFFNPLSLISATCMWVARRSSTGVGMDNLPVATFLKTLSDSPSPSYQLPIAPKLVMTHPHY